MLSDSREGVRGGWRKLNNEIVSMITSRRMGWEGPEIPTKFWLESLKGRGFL